MTPGQGSPSTLAVAVFSVCTRARSVAAIQTFSLMCALLFATCAFNFAQSADRADDKDKVVPSAANATHAFTPPVNQETKTADNKADAAKAADPQKTGEAKPAGATAEIKPISAPETGPAAQGTIPPTGAASPASTTGTASPTNEDAPVHVEPRPVSKPESARPAIPMPSDIPGIKTRTKPIIKDVNLVLVPVTITDPMNRLVTGLEKDNFMVYEGDKTQPIQSFSSEDAPISLGVIFDVSGSMSDKITKSRDAVVEFFKNANPQDEFFMITFADKPELLADFTKSVEEVQDKMITIQAKGRTALLDAIYLGLDKMRNAHNQKKALLIISDGGDNRSRYTESEIKNLVREADVQIYAIGIYEAAPPTPEERAGPALLTDISEVTGGRTFSIDNASELADVASKIGVELRNQYVIGYRPINPAHDGKWRKIKVKLNPPKGLPPLHVYAKTGYYAPNE
jgi:Ca-activated chloride channel family protein